MNDADELVDIEDEKVHIDDIAPAIIGIDISKPATSRSTCSSRVLSPCAHSSRGNFLKAPSRRFPSSDRSPIIESPRFLPFLNLHGRDLFSTRSPSDHASHTHSPFLF